MQKFIENDLKLYKFRTLYKTRNIEVKESIMGLI